MSQKWCSGYSLPDSLWMLLQCLSGLWLAQNHFYATATEVILTFLFSTLSVTFFFQMSHQVKCHYFLSMFCKLSDTVLVLFVNLNWLKDFYPLWILLICYFYQRFITCKSFPSTYMYNWQNVRVQILILLVHISQQWPRHFFITKLFEAMLFCFTAVTQAFRISVYRCHYSDFTNFSQFGFISKSVYMLHNSDSGTFSRTKFFNHCIITELFQHLILTLSSHFTHCCEQNLSFTVTGHMVSVLGTYLIVDIIWSYSYCALLVTYCVVHFCYDKKLMLQP